MMDSRPVIQLIQHTAITSGAVFDLATRAGNVQISYLVPRLAGAYDGASKLACPDR